MNIKVSINVKKIQNAARVMALNIAEMPGQTTDEQVLNVVMSSQRNKRILCDAFWLLDEQPTRFANHKIWHPRLRRLRNNPIVGARLFDQFK